MISACKPRPPPTSTPSSPPSSTAPSKESCENCNAKIMATTQSKSCSPIRSIWNSIDIARLERGSICGAVRHPCCCTRLLHALVCRQVGERGQSAGDDLSWTIRLSDALRRRSATACWTAGPSANP